MKTLLLCSAASAFAGKTEPTPPVAPKTAPAAAPATDAKAARVAPVLTDIAATVIPLPVRKSNRGSVSAYPFDKLETVGASFGVTNKTASQLSSIVSNQNRKCMIAKTDGEGKPVMKTKALTDPTTGKTVDVPTTDPIMVYSKRYAVYDVDPKTDPNGATARVWRVNPETGKID